MSEVDRLRKACEAMRDDILLRADIDDDGTRCVNVSDSKWREFNDALDDQYDISGPDDVVANEMAKKADLSTRLKKFKKRWAEEPVGIAGKKPESN